ncbi:hypothetical protein EIL50_05005 [bacterium NHP-B]|nr:hypothetical protein EIL50_05005 [bacterium NHP-B]
MYRLTHLLLSAFVVSASLTAPLGAIKKNMVAAARAEDTLRKDIDAWKARADKALSNQDRQQARMDVAQAYGEADGLIQRCVDLRRDEWQREIEQTKEKLKRRGRDLRR